MRTTKSMVEEPQQGQPMSSFAWQPMQNVPMPFIHHNRFVENKPHECVFFVELQLMPQHPPVENHMWNDCQADR